METELSAEESQRDLTLLNSIEQNPDISQATLAATLGVAVGTINWHLKRMVAKGYVKVKRMQRKKLRYILTPEGIALRANLTVEYIQNSFSLYNLIRQRTKKVLEELDAFGFKTVRIEGEGEVTEVCLLTCLEQGIEVCQNTDAPIIRIDGLKLALKLPSKNTAALIKQEESMDSNGKQN
ncbi:MAG: winged helix-turn-helix transcriptional regulator [Anaerolineaceae bacterium]|nr:winged helix-turn-helix transcriptional regulator [Anaerolineaceae bacterium]